MSARTDRIEGRDVFGNEWEAWANEDNTVLATSERYARTGACLDAPSALRLGAFLLARGLGAADGSVRAGTLVLVAPKGAGPVDVLDVAERARRAEHAAPVVVVPSGWTVLIVEDLDGGAEG